ncbi:MAG: hypothetical protein U9N36_05530, partial [Euryarchaeota archaeon]|nr:hypothetical protein [Euryarchaeota archaeon]
MAIAVHVGTATAHEGGAAWINASKSNFENTSADVFDINDTVYAFGHLGWYSKHGDNGGRIYVVNHSDSWTNGTSLKAVGGSPYYVSYEESGYFCGELAWSQPLTPGRYDLVLDLNVTGCSDVWSSNVSVVINGSTINVTDPIFPFNVTAPSAGISIEKTAEPTEGEPGTDVTFTIVVYNTGDFILDPVKVVDTLPAGMIYDGAELGGDKLPDGTITWANVGPLDTGGSIEIALYARICYDASGMQTNNVIVSGTSEAGNVTDSASVDIDVLTPDICVTKTADSTEGVPGTNVTFTITVANVGNIMLDPVIVEDTLPEELNYVYDDHGGIESGMGVTWNIHLMDTLDSVDITLVAQIGANASGTLKNRVDVRGIPTVSSSDVVTDYDTAEVDVLTPDIRVDKTAYTTGSCPGIDPLIASIGDNVTYCFNVTNTGGVTLTNVTLVDNHCGIITLGTDTLAPEQSVNGTATHTVNESDIPSETNIATVTATDPTNKSVTNIDTCTIIVNYN